MTLKYCLIGGLVIWIMLSLTTNTMEKKEKRDSNLLSPRTLYDVINDRFKVIATLTTKVQINVNESIKNKGKLDEVWQKAFGEITIKPVVYRLDNVLFAQVDITEATKKLKKHYKPQIQAKTIRQIQSGKLTSPFKPIQSPAPKSTLVSTTFYGLAFITMGWFGKKLWDDQVKHHLFNLGARAMHSILNELNVYN